MARKKFQVYNTIGRPEVVYIDQDATPGAIVGVNLYNQDGTIWVPPAPANGGAPISSTTWPLVLEKPPNIVKVAELATSGLVVRKADGNWITRALVQPAAGITIADPGGDANAPTFALANDLAALEGLSSTGIAVRTGIDTWAQRSIAVASTARLTVASASGAAGDPTLDLATLADSGAGTFLKLTRDAYGRVSGTIAVAKADVKALTTTVGANLYDLPNPGAITFIRINADNSVSTLDAATFRAAIGAGTGGGSVTSVAMSVPTGLSVAGSPITGAGTLAVTYTAGYVGYTTAEQTKLAGVATGATANLGTVTSVSVVTANGVSGSVATATTTPAITLTLGAITPTSVVASGTISAYTGTVGTQTILTNMGWVNAVPRWKDVIEASGARSWWSYDTGGATATKVLELSSVVAGGTALATFTGAVTATSATGGTGMLNAVSNSTNSTWVSVRNTAASGREWLLYSSGSGPSAVGTFGIWDNTGGGNRLTISPTGVVDISSGVLTVAGSTVYHTGNLITANFVQGNTANRTGQFPTDSANDQVGSGFFELTPSGTNGPVAATWAWVMNFRHSNTGNHYGWQIANNIGTDNYYLRAVNGGAWSAWDRIATVGWLAGSTAKTIGGNNTYSGQSTFTEDVFVRRSAAPTTGVVYFGNTGTKYHYWDGSNHNIEGGPLLVNSAGSYNGSLTFNGLSRRILANTTDATLSNRFFIQDSTANAQTMMGVLPNGTGTASVLAVFGSSDANNSTILTMEVVTTGACTVNATKVGTGPYGPLALATSGAGRIIIGVNGEVFVRDAAAVPGTNPVSGGYLYCQAGALKYRGSSGTVTNIANA